jgi:hypothetical protein
MTKIWLKFDGIKIMKNLDFRLGLIDDWEQVKSLYVKSFPSYERQPVSLIKDRIQANVCKFFLKQRNVLALPYYGNLKKMKLYLLNISLLILNSEGKAMGKKL